MGVCSCSRKGCDEIMCDTNIDGIGYLCYSCQNEFSNLIENEDLKLFTENELKIKLEKFINTLKGSNNKITINQFFEKYTN